MGAPNSGSSFWRGRIAAISLLVVTSFGLGACAELGLLLAESAPENATDAPQTVETNYERGKRELSAGRLGLAVRYFLAALNRTPESVEALNGLGAAFDRLGRFDLSARAYGRALAVDPDSVQTLNNMGYSFYLQGRYDLAVAYLRDASSRAGAGALTTENHRLAEVALARAGGPPPRSPDGTPLATPMPAEGPRKPYLRRAGKAVRELVTMQSDVASSDPAAKRETAKTARASHNFASLSGDLLPAFVAAPMAIEGTWAGVPALGAAREPSLPDRSGGS